MSENSKIYECQYCGTRWEIENCRATGFVFARFLSHVSKCEHKSSQERSDWLYRLLLRVAKNPGKHVVIRVDFHHKGFKNEQKIS
jgi:hypothetical protein